MKIKVGSASPWGRVQFLHVISEGVVQVSTASHGGIKLDSTRNAQLPRPLRNVGGWYEEDCEVAKVIAGLPELFSEEDVGAAIASLKNWNPDEYEAWTGKEIPLSESGVKRERAFKEANQQNFVTRAAWGDWKAGVPKGMVGVLACRASDGAEGYFLIPQGEYAARAGAFVVDLARHQQVPDFTNVA